VIIPYQQLSNEALNGIIEEYITRNSDSQLSLEDATVIVHQQLKRGDIVVVYDKESEGCNILTRSEAAKNSAVVS
jgi:uncharacterized protein YheU (UPF0270 family)